MSTIKAFLEIMPSEDPAVDPNLSLFLNALGLQRRYGVILHLGTAAQPLKVHYEVIVSCTQVASEDAFQVLFQKEQIYINEKTPDSILDTLADDFGKVLYPLLVEVNAKGAFRRIGNVPEIQKRWQEARPALARYFTGEIAERALAGMDRAVANEIFMTQMLRHDWLFTLLYAPVYRQYQEHEAFTEILLPVVAYKPPVKYGLSLKAEAQRTESGFLRIKVAGTCTDERSAVDILKGIPVPLTAGKPVAGGVALDYKLYPHNGTLFSVTGEVTLQLPAGEKRVEVEVYQLNPRDYIPSASQNTTSIIMEIETIPKKEGWRSFFK